MKSEKKKEHYVNNKEFLAAMTEYKKLCVEAEESGDTKSLEEVIEHAETKFLYLTKQNEIPTYELMVKLRTP